MNDLEPLMNYLEHFRKRNEVFWKILVILDIGIVLFLILLSLKVLGAV